MSIHSERTLIDWVVSTLTTGGLTVGNGVAPKSPPANAGYVVVYGIAGGTTSGTLDDPRSNADGANFQVTSVGDDPRQVRWLVDKVRTLLDAAVPAALTGGRRVLWLDFPMASTTLLRDDDVSPPNWYTPDRMTVGTGT